MENFRFTATRMKSWIWFESQLHQISPSLSVVENEGIRQHAEKTLTPGAS